MADGARQGLKHCQNGTAMNTIPNVGMADGARQGLKLRSFLTLCASLTRSEWPMEPVRD